MRPARFRERCWVAAVLLTSLTSAAAPARAEAPAPAGQGLEAGIWTPATRALRETMADGKPTIVVITSRSAPESAALRRDLEASERTRALTRSVRLAEMPAEIYAKQVAKLGVKSFPTVVVYREEGGKLQTVAAKAGLRDADGLFAWLIDLAPAGSAGRDEAVARTSGDGYASPQAYPTEQRPSAPPYVPPKQPPAAPPAYQPPAYQPPAYQPPAYQPPAYQAPPVQYVPPTSPTYLQMQPPAMVVQQAPQQIVLAPTPPPQVTVAMAPPVYSAPPMQAPPMQAPPNLFAPPSQPGQAPPSQPGQAPPAYSAPPMQAPPVYSAPPMQAPPVYSAPPMQAPPMQAPPMQAPPMQAPVGQAPTAMVLQAPGLIDSVLGTIGENLARRRNPRVQMSPVPMLAQSPVANAPMALAPAGGQAYTTMTGYVPSGPPIGVVTPEETSFAPCNTYRAPCRFHRGICPGPRGGGDDDWDGGHGGHRGHGGGGYSAPPSGPSASPQSEGGWGFFNKFGHHN